MGEIYYIWNSLHRCRKKCWENGMKKGGKVRKNCNRGNKNRDKPSVAAMAALRWI
jgi:hypothetical protein